MKKSNKRLLLIHIAIIIAGAAYLLSGAFYNAIWFDESYTVGLMSINMPDMLHASAHDVHPQMYYILLKLFTYVFGNSIVVLRLFSVLGAVLLAILGLTHIRKDFGAKTGIWFSALVYLLPCTYKYSQQIRMYTWAPLLVMLAAIYGYRYIQGKVLDDKCFSDNKQIVKNRIIFLITAVMAAYSHYYGLAAVGLINLVMLFAYIKNKKKIGSWIVNAVIEFAAYIPGFVVFAIQLGLNGADWIRVKYPSVLIDSLAFNFMGAPANTVDISSATYIFSIVIGAVFFSMMVLLLVLKIKREKMTTENWTIIGALFVYFGVIAAFLLISEYREIYYSRYSIISYGLLIFAMAKLLGSVDIKRYAVTAGKLVLVVILIVVSTLRADQLMAENYSSNNSGVTDYLDSNLQDGDIFVFDAANAFAITVQYPEHAVYFYNMYGWAIWEGYKAFGDKVVVSKALDELSDYHGRIWVVNRNSEGAWGKLMNTYKAKEIKSIKIKLDYYPKENDFELILLEL